MLFQTFSRPNDSNGKPYRLMLCYNEVGDVTEVYEDRTSSPNKVNELRKTRGELPCFHLSPSEYNETRAAFKHLLGARP